MAQEWGSKGKGGSKGEDLMVATTTLAMTLTPARA